MGQGVGGVGVEGKEVPLGVCFTVYAGADDPGWPGRGRADERGDWGEGAGGRKVGREGELLHAEGLCGEKTEQLRLSLP